MIADDLISKVLVACFWPATNAPLSSEEILSLADDEISETLWPQMHASNGDYHLATLDRALSADKARYRLPPVMWGPLKELVYVDAEGKIRDFAKLDLAQLGRLAREERPAGLDTPYYCYLDGDYIGVHPVPRSAEGSIRFTYYRSPSQLVLQASARKVASVTSSTVLELESGGTGWTGSSVVDLVGGGGSHQVLAASVGVTSLAGTTLTLAGAVTDIEEGDWVSLEGTTPVAQIPKNLEAQLVSLVATQCLSSQGDDKGVARVASKAIDRERRAQSTLQPRNEAEPTIIVGRRGFFR